MNSKGYTYFIQCADWYKIGATVDVKKRIANIQTCCPFPVKLLHKIKSDNMHLTEKLFQDMFERSDKQRSGEWFLLSPKDIQYIKSGKYSTQIMDSIGSATRPAMLPDILAV